MNNIYEIDFDADKPVSTKNEDSLNRYGFAKVLANCILNYDNNDCLTIGLMGEWGSGKTSIIKMAIGEIEKNSDSRIKIINFNPWDFSNQFELVLNFFDVLNDSIPISKGHQNYKENMKNYINKLLKSFQINVGWGWGSLNFNPSSFAADENNEEHSLQYFKDRLINDFKNYDDNKFLIVIDDIDRLTDAEVSQIFQLVKSLADFPNVIYLLAFDKNAVVNVLERLQSYSPDKFLEKIIQVPIYVPKIQNSSFKRLLYDELKDLFEKHLDLDQINFKKYLEELVKYLSIFIKNIRDLKRYKNVLNFYLPVFKNEVNIFDYSVVTAIQLFENDIYNEIKKSKFLFIYKKHEDANKKDDYRLHLDKIFEKSRNMELEDFNKLMGRLFPRVNWILSPNDISILFYNNDSQDNKRIHYYDMFDKYFTLSLEDTDADYELFSYLINAKNVQEIVEFIKKVDSENKLISLLVDFEHNVDYLYSEKIYVFVEAFMDLAGDVNDYYESGFPFIIEKLLKLNSNNDNFEFLENYFKRDSSNLISIINLFLSLCECFDVYFKGESNKLDEEPLISRDQFNELKKLVDKKLEVQIRSKLVLDNKVLSGIFKYWKKWDEVSLNKFLNENLVEDDLLKILRGFSSNRLIQGIFIKREIRVNLKDLNEYFDLHKLKERIEKINLNESLSNEDKKFCEVFLNQFENGPSR